MEPLFRVVLTPGEDGYIVAECVDLPGCMSQGKTEQEALENIEDACSVWVARNRPSAIWREGTERCLRNRLEMGQFLVFPYPEEAGPLRGPRSRSGWNG